MRSGSKKKTIPSIGLGLNVLPPETIWIMTASPSARADASTAAATIAGRTAFSVTARAARIGFTPSATAPSRHDEGTALSASQIERDHDRRDHHREDHRGDAETRAIELHHVLDRLLLLCR